MCSSSSWAEGSARRRVFSHRGLPSANVSGRVTARADAAGPVGGQAAGAAAQQTLHGGGRDGGEQADAVDAVFAQHLRLARADAVQGLDRQRPEPVGTLVGADGEDTAGLVELAGGAAAMVLEGPIPSSMRPCRR
ncbi:hypothetical protein [Streptomyces chartreusis]|uniref:hypothetical protein n=1 Tax=Streptomyces chartreusis TaxID=1969 RepID=UPI000262F2BC|nr:hypothetical protein [Streptomyces chartreusis]